MSLTTLFSPFRQGRLALVDEVEKPAHARFTTGHGVFRS